MLMLHVCARQKRKIPWGELKIVTAGQVEQNQGWYNTINSFNSISKK